MKDFLKRIKADYIMSSVLTIALGVVFIVFRAGILDLIGSVFAIILVTVGLLYVGSYFLGLMSNNFSIVMGLIVLAIGIWFLVQPRAVSGLIPILIGMVLMFHGIRGMLEAVASKNYGSKTWKLGMLFATISVVIGIICVVDAFGIMENAVAVVGIFLIYNGISNIFIAGGSTRAERRYRKGDTIDVEFVDDDTTGSIEGR